jgi:hypothetical protein
MSQRDDPNPLPSANTAEPPQSFPREESTPMLDIHPAHHAATTWRDFFIHIATIVLGLLIAISLEQTVEYFHHRHLGAEAHRALIEERRANETSNEFNIFATRHHQQDLQRNLTILHALRAHQPLPPGPFILRHFRYIYGEDNWRKIHQSGTVNYLTEGLGPIAYRYENQDAFMARAERSIEDLYRAGAVLRSEHDPPNTTFEDNLAASNFGRRIADSHETLPRQEVDSGFAKYAEIADLTKLSPSQIDTLEHAIQVALVDDDALLTYCFNIKRNPQKQSGIVAHVRARRS